MTGAYLALLRTLAVLGAGRAAFAALVVLTSPEILVATNPWGIPRWPPLTVAVALAGLVAVLLVRTSALVWAAMAALWGAGAWAFSTPVLIEAGVDAGPWWALFVALPVAAPLIGRLIVAGWRPFGIFVGLVVLAGVAGSLQTSPAAVHLAAAIVYPLTVVGAAWSTRWAIRRSDHDATRSLRRSRKRDRHPRPHRRHRQDQLARLV